MICPNCSTEISAELLVTGVQLPPPIYPMYDMRVAAELIPCSYEALRQWLWRYQAKYPPRYRVYQDAKGIRRRVRVVSSREILQIRSERLRGPGKDTQ